MDRTYILHRIYTSENSAEHRDTQLSEMYPDVAGTKEAVEKALNRRIEDATAEKGLLWIGMAFIVNNGIYKEPQWKSDVRNINYQALRVLGITKFNRRVMVILSEIIGKTLKFEIVNPTGRKIVIVKEVPISDVADIETFITDPSNDYYEVKKTIT